MSKKRVLLIGLSVLLAAGSALATPAQQPQEPAAPESEEQRPEPLLRIRVLEHPYDLASFYRSSQGYGLSGPSMDASDRYPIARYYRLGPPSPHGYSRFWTNGYAGPRGRAMGYRRSIGENGDLFLMAPTFLAPVGPLTGVFLEGR